MPKIRTIQLVPVSDTSALVVIVTDMGIVRDQVVQVASDLDSDALYAISKTLTERLQGLTLHEAVAQMPQLMQECTRTSVSCKAWARRWDSRTK